jgi:hypothetical protein
MRYIALPAILVTVSLVACEGHGPTAPLAAPDASLLSAAASACGNLAGTVVARFVDGEAWDIEGDVFDAGGDRIGAALAWIDEVMPRSEGAMGLRMRHKYIIDGSELDTVDEGILAPAGPPVFLFNNRLEVVGGTGAFDGATGFLRAHGTVDFGTGSIELAYRGRVCG